MNEENFQGQPENLADVLGEVAEALDSMVYEGRVYINVSHLVEMFNEALLITQRVKDEAAAQGIKDEEELEPHVIGYTMGVVDIATMIAFVVRALGVRYADEVPVDIDELMKEIQEENKKHGGEQ